MRKKLTITFQSLIFTGFAIIGIVTIFSLSVTVSNAETIVLSSLKQTSPPFLNMLQDNDLIDERESLVKATDNSLRYLQSAESVNDYRVEFKGAITHDHVLKSVLRFRRLLDECKTTEQLYQLISAEFYTYSVSGKAENVKFTGYFQPVFKASRAKDMHYRYPIYAVPDSFDTWKLPHPKRIELEGDEGFGLSQSPLFGYEIGWLSSRYDVFLLQMQGSGILNFTDGTSESIGYAAGTKYPFVGLPKDYLQQHRVSWTGLGRFFNSYPGQLNWVMNRNNRVIMFTKRATSEPVGSLGVPVVARYSIATDKRIMPPGALAMIRTRMPTYQTEGAQQGRIVQSRVTKLVLDQDAGSAILGPARVDLYMGTGDIAKQEADHLNASGELYYLLLRS